jgi:hypothetical protein
MADPFITPRFGLTLPNVGTTQGGLQGTSWGVDLTGSLKTLDALAVTQAQLQAVIVSFSGSTTLSGSFNVIPTVSVLRNTAGSGSNVSAILQGYYAPGDGGGQTLVWNPTSTATDNSGTIFQPTGVSTGRWESLNSSVWHTKQFGVVANGATDDTVAIQNALDSLPRGQALFFDPGVSLITQPLIVRNQYNVVLTGPSGPMPGALTGGPVLEWYSGPTAADPLFNLWTGPMLIVGPEANSPTFPFTTSLSGAFYTLNMPNINNEYEGVPFCLTDVDCGVINNWGSVSGSSTTAMTGFTCECWVNDYGNVVPSNQTTTIAASSGRRDLQQPLDQAFQFSILTGSHLNVKLETTNGSFNFHSTNLLPVNTLTHVAVTYDRSFLRLFIGGVLSDVIPCTGAIVQKSWEDFCIGYNSGQYTLGIKDGGIIGTLGMASFRLTSACLYTANFTPPTSQLSCIVGAATVAICINFDPKYMMYNGLWIKAYSGMSSPTSGRHSNGDPVYLYLGHNSNSYGINFNVVNGHIFENFSLTNGALGEDILCYAGNQMLFRNLQINACQAGITLLGGYGHLIDDCIIACSQDIQAHSWCVATIENPGGVLNKMVNCQCNGGWYTVLTTGGMLIDSVFVNNTPAFCGLGCYSTTPNLGNIDVRNCAWDDEQTGTADSGMFICGMNTVTLKNNSPPGEGNSPIPLYKLGGNGYVEIDGIFTLVNLSSPGVIELTSNMVNNTPITLPNIFNESNALVSGSVLLLATGSSFVDPILSSSRPPNQILIPTNETGVTTINFPSNANLNLTGFQETFGTWVITDVETVLTGTADVVIPYLWPNIRRTVSNQTAQTLVVGSSPFTSGSVSVPPLSGSTIWSSGTGWKKLF